MSGAPSDHPAHTGIPPRSALPLGSAKNIGGEKDTVEPIIMSGYRSIGFKRFRYEVNSSDGLMPVTTQHPMS